MRRPGFLTAPCMRRPASRLTISSHSETDLATKLAFVVVVSIAIGVFGNYWFQRLRIDMQVAQLQTQAYANYVAYTQPVQDATSPATTANSTPQAPMLTVNAVNDTTDTDLRDALLAHPAVVPGRGFDQPGVQATAKTILDAMERAQRPAL